MSSNAVTPASTGTTPAQRGAFAIAYTIRNEAALLPAAIAFHEAAGCSRFYVFWDGTTDDGPALLRGRANIVAQDSVSPDRLRGAPGLSVDPGRWADDFIERQRVNAAYAASLAAADGIEWLLFIDPDELVLLDAHGGEDGSVARLDMMLATIPDEIDQVLAPNVEVVATGAPMRCPFADCTVFLARRPTARAVWRACRLSLLRVLRSDRVAAWFDHWFYKAATLGRFPQRMRDPRTGRLVPRSYYLGYHSYKAFVRSARAGSFDFAVHRWTASALAKPRTVKRGLVLHYDLFDVASFAGKFRQRQSRWGKTPGSVRSRLAEIARTLDDAALQAFFDRDVAVDARRIARLVGSGALIEVRGPAAFFARWRRERGGGPALDAPSGAE